jgi:hypothetical protein
MPSPVNRTAGPEQEQGPEEHTATLPAPPVRERVGPRLRWRRWRRSRPFWGGLVTAVAGAEICVIPLAPMEVMLHQGIAGVPSVLLGIVMIMLGVSVWWSPQYRSLAGVVTTLIAAAALVMSNLGGFLIGTVLGIVGGAMTFAWQPVAASRHSTGTAPPPSAATTADT